jgi:DNA primase
MRIPESKIEEIRSSTSIVDIISDFVQLRKRGKNFIGLCPFHSEKTPSFTVSEEKQIFHCFGCHTGGNVFKFLMEYQKISFIEAVQELAEKIGIALEYDEDIGTEKQSEQELLYEINTTVARYFSDNLLKNDKGEIARKYFENRKIKIQTMRSFGLGYALPSRDDLVNFLTEKKTDIERSITLGLISSYEDGRLYDKFSGRIIFPIFSPNGRVVAFAGRVLEAEQKAAKYLNSPESLIYVKGRTLYGLSLSKDEIRKVDKAIIVEGYMDLISLFQNGIKNVVAVSGTALTDEQVQLLSRYTKNVVLLFDADTAGIKASMRSIEILLKRDIDIKIASVPAGEDPDSFVNKYGKERFDEIIQRSQNFLEYQSAYYESQGMFEEPAKMAEAIRELVKPVALINDELKRTLLIKTIAKNFNLREKLLENELAHALAEQNRFKEREISRKEIVQKVKEKTIAKTGNKSKLQSESNLINERELIELLYMGDEKAIKSIFENIQIDDFEIEIHRNLAKIVYDAFCNKDELSAGSLLDKITEIEEHNYLMEIISDKYSVSSRWEEVSDSITHNKLSDKYLSDIIRKKRIDILNKMIEVNIKKIESSQDENEILELMRNEVELKNERASLLKVGI